MALSARAGRGTFPCACWQRECVREQALRAAAPGTSLRSRHRDRELEGSAGRFGQGGTSACWCVARARSRSWSGRAAGAFVRSALRPRYTLAAGGRVRHPPVRPCEGGTRPGRIDRSTTTRSDWSSSHDPRPAMRWERMKVSSSRPPTLGARRRASLQLLTPEHGRHAGLVRGASAGRPGAHLHARQPRERPVERPAARASGAFRLRADRCPARPGSSIIRCGLAAVSSVCALAEWFLAEREPVPAVHAASEAILDRLAGTGDWRRRLRVLWS